VDNFISRRYCLNTKTTADEKINLHHDALRHFASNRKNLVIDERRKRTTAFTIFGTAAVIAALVVLLLPSFPHILQAQAQGSQLNPATTQIINQIASQVANSFGGDATQVAQVLQQIAVQISQDANTGRAIQAVSQIFGQLIIGGNQAPISQALSNWRSSKLQVKTFSKQFPRLVSK